MSASMIRTEQARSHPRVSIVLMSCDRPEWCATALHSVLLQTHSDFEVLVRDDSTGDGVRAMTSAISDPRVRYARGQCKGQLDNFLGGLRETEGEIVLVLHDDDWWEPALLERLVPPMLADETLDLATAPFFYVGAYGEPLGRATRLRQRHHIGEPRSGVVTHDDFGTRARELLVERRISPFIGTAMRRRCLAGLHIPAEAGSVLDLWLCSHLARTTKRWLFVPEYLAAYRVHGASIASSMADLDHQRWCVDAFLRDPELAPIHDDLRTGFRDFRRGVALGWLVTGDRARARTDLRDLRSEYRWRARLIHQVASHRPGSYCATKWLRYRNARFSSIHEEHP